MCKFSNNSQVPKLRLQHFFDHETEYEETKETPDHLKGCKRQKRSYKTKDVIIFRLLVFNNGGNDKRVPNIILDNQIENSGRKYNITGVVVHAGSTVDSGHYKAFVKICEDWYLVDDMNKEAKPLYELPAWSRCETPYIVFYQSKNRRFRETKPTVLWPNKNNRNRNMECFM